MTFIFYVGLFTLIYVLLSVHVVKGRQRFQVVIGHNDNEQLLRRIRAHANFAEYTPFFLIALGCAEYTGLPAYAVHLFGMIFLIGRLSHAYSILDVEQRDLQISERVRFRFIGMICTYSTLTILALFLLFKYLIH